MDVISSASIILFFLSWNSVIISSHTFLFLQDNLGESVLEMDYGFTEVWGAWGIGSYAPVGSTKISPSSIISTSHADLCIARQVDVSSMWLDCRGVFDVFHATFSASRVFLLEFVNVDKMQHNLSSWSQSDGIWLYRLRNRSLYLHFTYLTAR